MRDCDTGFPEDRRKLQARRESRHGRAIPCVTRHWTPPQWKNLASGSVFTDTLSPAPLFGRDTITLTIPGLSAGQTIFIIGDGQTYNHDYSGDRVELELYHNGTLLTRRRFQTIVSGASGYKHEDMTIMGVATATAGTNTVEVVINVVNIGSSVQVKTFRLTAIVF